MNLGSGCDKVVFEERIELDQDSVHELLAADLQLHQIMGLNLEEEQPGLDITQQTL